jgi:hypothetical protein
MTNRIFAASYERGIELIAAGCPLDYPDALAHHSTARRKTFRAEQLNGYFESGIYALNSMQTNYVIGLRLGTDRPGGTVISDWSFMPPWQDHWVNFDYDPEEFIREETPKTYRTLVDGRLMRVLNEGVVLRRGYPVEGLLCGISFQPVPESANHYVTAKLTLADDIGNSVAVRLVFTIVRSARFAQIRFRRAHAGLRPARTSVPTSADDGLLDSEYRSEGICV